MQNMTLLFTVMWSIKKMPRSALTGTNRAFSYNTTLGVAAVDSNQAGHTRLNVP